MARQQLTCLLVGIFIAGGAFAWLNTTNAVHVPATYIVEYQLQPRPDQPACRSIPAEMRFGSGCDESAHGVAIVRLDLPTFIPIKPAPQHVIRIERVGKKSDASRDSQVFIHQARVAGQTVLPQVLGKGHIGDPGVELLEAGATALFRGPFQRLDLALLRHDWSGVVRLQVDDCTPLEIDLFAPQRDVHAIAFVEAPGASGLPAVAAPALHRAVRRLSLRTIDPQDQFRVTRLFVLSSRDVRSISIPEALPDSHWQYLSWRGLSARRHHALTWNHAVMALLFGCAAAAIVARLTRQRASACLPPASSPTLVTAIVIALLASQALFWLAAAWPAIMTTDSLSVWQQTQDLAIDTWLSHTYVSFVLMTRQVWDSPATLSIVQIVLTFLIAGGVFCGLLRRGLRPAAVIPFVLLFVTAIPVGAYAMYHTRDTLFGLTGVAIAAVVYFWGWRALCRPPCSPSRPVFLALALLAGCHATVRAEGVLLLGLLPPALWLVVRLPLWRVVAFALVSVGLWYALGTPLIRALGIQTSPLYSLTAKLDPLGAIVTGPYNTDDPAEDRAVIERIVPLERLQQRHKNIEVFWDGSINLSAITPEDLQAFDRLYSTLVRRNLAKFLANRWDNFARLCCSNDQFNLGGLLNLGFGGQMSAHMREMGLNEQAVTPFPPLRDFLRRLLSNSLRPGQTPVDWRSIIWNLWPAVALTIAAILAFRRIPVTATTALLVGYRIPLIFAAAPASMFKYLYDVYFLGFFLVPMALLELGARSPRLARFFLRRKNS